MLNNFKNNFDHITPEVLEAIIDTMIKWTLGFIGYLVIVLVVLIAIKAFLGINVLRETRKLITK